MHLPDSYLSQTAAVGFCCGAALLVGRSTARLALSKEFERRVPFIGVLAALVFAMRMVRFPLPGTDAGGHLSGALLAAALVGPDAAFVALVAVQLVQATVFADGGFLALGTNLVNGAAWSVWLGLPLLRLLAPPGARPVRLVGAAVVAAVVAGELSALGVALAVGAGSRPELSSLRFLLLVSWAQVPISALEGLATAAVLLLGRHVFGTDADGAMERAGGTGVLGVLGVALFAAAVLADFASTRPEWPQWAMTGASRAALPDAWPLAARAADLQRRVAFLPEYGAATSPAGTLFGQAATSVAGLFGALVSSLLALLPAIVVARARHVAAAVRARRARADVVAQVK